MATKHIKLSTELVQQLQKVKDVRVRSRWRKQFKNDYAVKEMYEHFIQRARTPLPDNAPEWEQNMKSNMVKYVPEREFKLREIKHRISRYEEKLNEFIKGDQDQEKLINYCLWY